VKTSTKVDLVLFLKMEGFTAGLHKSQPHVLTPFKHYFKIK